MLLNQPNNTIATISIWPTSAIMNITPTTNTTTVQWNSAIQQTNKSIVTTPHPPSQNKTENTLLLFLSFIAFVANFLVCLPIIMVPRLRTTINCFILSLCVTQILTDCFVIPLYCFAMTSVVYQFVVAFVVISYITNLLALTLDRYFAIKYPLRYRGIMWRGRCIRVVIGCWLISTFVQILPIFWINSVHHQILQKVYLCIITLAFLLLPLCIVIFAYISIFMEILASNQKEKKRRVTFVNRDRLSEAEISTNVSSEHLNVDISENGRKLSNISTDSRFSASPSEFSSSTSLVRMVRKPKTKQQQIDFRVEVRTAVIFFVIILMYGATWIPVLIMTVAGVFEQTQKIPKSMNTCAIYIMAGNTLLDPLIYGWYMKDIRAHLAQMLSSIFPKLFQNKDGQFKFDEN